MFFRTKTSDSRQCLQIVENSREGGRVRQRVLTTLGRFDPLQQSSQLDGLIVDNYYLPVLPHLKMLSRHDAPITAFVQPLDGAFF